MSGRCTEWHGTGHKHQQLQHLELTLYEKKTPTNPRHYVDLEDEWPGEGSLAPSLSIYKKKGLMQSLILSCGEDPMGGRSWSSSNPGCLPATEFLGASLFQPKLKKYEAKSVHYCTS